VDDVGKAAFRPAWGALTAHIASFTPRQRAQTMGWLSWGEDVGEVLGPILTGFIWGAWGIIAVLAVRIGMAMAAEIYATLLIRGWKPRNVSIAPYALVDETVRASALRRAGGLKAANGRVPSGERAELR
jgi:hypothetical protein